MDEKEKNIYDNLDQMNDLDQMNETPEQLLNISSQDSVGDADPESPSNEESKIEIDDVDINKEPAHDDTFSVVQAVEPFTGYASAGNKDDMMIVDSPYEKDSKDMMFESITKLNQASELVLDKSSSNTQDEYSMVRPSTPEFKLVNGSPLSVQTNEPAEQLNSLYHVAQEDIVDVEHANRNRPGAFAVMGLNERRNDVFSHFQSTQNLYTDQAAIDGLTSEPIIAYCVEDIGSELSRPSSKVKIWIIAAIAIFAFVVGIGVAVSLTFKLSNPNSTLSNTGLNTLSQSPTSSNPILNSEESSRSSKIRALVSKLSSESDLNTILSPQANSLTWIMGKDNKDLDPIEDRERLSQRYVLATVLYSTGDSLFVDRFLSKTLECQWISSIIQCGETTTVISGLNFCELKGFLINLKFSQFNHFSCLPQLS